MIYFNQRDYANIPYPAPGYEQATIKTSGCGPTCFAMLIANKFNKTYTVQQAAKFALESGARVSGGTDMDILLKAASKAFSLKYERKAGIASALSAVRYNKAFCIANVGKSGLFSDSGHYVLIVDVGQVYLSVLDPYLYDGKFSKPGRQGKVIVSNNICYVKPEYLEMDAKGYYVVMEEKKMTAQEALNILQQKGIVKSPAYWQNALQVVKYLDELLVNMAENVK